MIYFDNAATTLKKPQCVKDAVMNALDSMGNSGRGAYESSLCASRTIYEARVALADLFGAPNPNRVIFTSNATEALNTAIFGLFAEGDHIISTDLEHNSVLRPLYELKNRGCEVDFVPADCEGRIRLADFESLRKANTKGVVVTHGSNLTGAVVDVAKIGAWAHENGLLLIVDASQTAGLVPINMGEMNIDVLCFTGHKGLMGPQGTGGICLSESVDICPLKMGGTGVLSYSETQPDRYPNHLEAGTLNAHGIAGLLTAVEYIKEVGIEKIYSTEHELYTRFVEGTAKIPGIKIYGGDFRHLPIVSLNISDIPSSEVSNILSEKYGVETRSGAHCAPRLHEALGTKEQGAVRFSFGFFNTIDEVDCAVKALEDIAREAIEREKIVRETGNIR